MKKGFTLIELLAVIVILAIIALIVTPVVSNIVANARIAANARSVEGHIRNIELAIISEAFIGSSTGDMDSYDTLTDGLTIEGRLSIPNNDIVKCSSYTIKHGTVLSASGCKDSEDKWGKKYSYNNTEGAYVFEFNGTVIWPGLDSNGNPTQDFFPKVKKSQVDIYKDIADSEGNSIVTYLAIVYMDPTNLKTVCNASSDINVSVREDKSGCMKFYIYDYDETSGKYKMLLDRNTSPRVEWISQIDYINYATSDEVGLTEEEATANWNAKKYTMYGPLTAMNKLKSDTDGWIGTTDLIDANEVAAIVGASSDDTISWLSTKTIYQYPGNGTSYAVGNIYFDGGRNSNPTTYSTTDGWMKQYCNTQGCSNYTWLFNNLAYCSSYGGDYYIDYSGTNNYTDAYWTKSSVSNNQEAWTVMKQGELFVFGVSRTSTGIRPVLTIDKSLLS